MIGILLAGGQSSRLGGGDKGRHRVGGRQILDRVIATMRLQCDGLVMNTNGDPARFADLGLPVVVDAIPDQPGPLAGVLAGLDHVAAHFPGVRFAVTVPADTPFLPVDLVARLQDARATDGATIACARSGRRPHYLTALWTVDMRHDIRRALGDGERAAHAFYQRHPFAIVDWPVTPFDPFFNVNTFEDLVEAERIAGMIV